MKKFLWLLFLPLFFGCDSDGFNNNNPYIGNYQFTVTLDTNLPAYNDLKFPGNGTYVPGYGERGLLVFNTGSGCNAFDAACPNQPLSNCSTMARVGINAVCPCDDAEYSFYSGRAAGMHYPMKQYRVEITGDLIRIYN
jgi:nitrite reductase/ring-hydroxylating ferredoxin subunit